MFDLERALAYTREHKNDALDSLFSLVEIPSDSTNTVHAPDVLRASEWIAERLHELGCKNVESFPTASHPVVFGELESALNNAPTILVYGHYDVMPAEPLEEWRTEPFKPTVVDEYVYARGTTDMKAQLIAFLHAVGAVLETTELPVNIKFLIEGEEELGSPNLMEFIDARRENLEADFCLNLDAGILAPDTPSIMYALRGLSYFDLTIRGPATDLHSGKFGGAIENPINVLCNLIAGMTDDAGRITLPGFYDDVRDLNDEERKNLAQLPQTNEWWLAQSGAPSLRKDTEFSPTERATVRPTLDVNGIIGGFTQEGGKTVLPSKASAKISMRLVPDQTPVKIRRSLEAYLFENTPATVTWKLDEQPGCKPSIMNLDQSAVQAGSRAFETAWGRAPLFTRDGGSVPVVGIINEQLGLDSLLLGFGLPDDNPHGPNERQHLPTFYRGIETYLHFFHQLVSGFRQ